MKQSMFNHWISNKGFTLIPTHYIVWCSGDIAKVNDEELIVWAVAKDKYNTNEQVSEANRYGIHIEIVGDFNINEPSQKQYEAINKLIKEIEARNGKLEIKWHKDFASKNCPWTKFEREKITAKPMVAPKQKTQGDKFILSRYYSPVEWQKNYFRWGYENDYKMNCQWDCSITANGTKLTKEMVGKVGACPKEMKWQTIKLDLWWEVIDFYCADVGSAITEWRIDIRCWFWQEWYDNIKSWKCKNPWIATVKF